MGESWNIRVPRRGFIAMVAGSGVAALSGCGGNEDSGTAEFGEGDIGILNFALIFEHLTADLYAEAARSGFLNGIALATVRKFGEEESRHIEALATEVEKLGGKPLPKSKTTLRFENAGSMLAMAEKLENVGAAAYLGQLPAIESPSVLKKVATIHSVEGRHAAALAILRSGSSTPDRPLAKPIRAAAAMKSIEPFVTG